MLFDAIILFYYYFIVGVSFPLLFFFILFYLDVLNIDCNKNKSFLVVNHRKMIAVLSRHTSVSLVLSFGIKLRHIFGISVDCVLVLP